MRLAWHSTKRRWESRSSQTHEQGCPNVLQVLNSAYNETHLACGQALAREMQSPASRARSALASGYPPAHTQRLLGLSCDEMFKFARVSVQKRFIHDTSTGQ